MITDLKNLFGKPFIVYPNPVEDILHIDFFEALQDVQISYRINDVSGKLVKEGLLDQQTIDWSNILPGIYFLSVNVNGIWYVEGVVKR